MTGLRNNRCVAVELCANFLSKKHTCLSFSAENADRLLVKVKVFYNTCGEYSNPQTVDEEGTHFTYTTKLNKIIAILTKIPGISAFMTEFLIIYAYCYYMLYILYMLYINTYQFIAIIILIII